MKSMMVLRIIAFSIIYCCHSFAFSFPTKTTTIAVRSVARNPVRHTIAGPTILTVKESCGKKAIAQCATSSSRDISTTGSANSASRMKRISSLMNWAKMKQIKVAEGVHISSASSNNKDNTGLGIFSKNNPGSVLIEVPTTMALTAQMPRDTSNPWISSLFSEERYYADAPWWVKLSLQINSFQRGISKNNNVQMTPWIQALPTRFDTPIHWSSLQELQYAFLNDAVQLQRSQWKEQYNSILPFIRKDSSLSSLTYTEFVWGCECARSRAFSGSSYSPWNPAPLFFTLLLVTVYVGLDLGTLEQAANGAAVVFCATIFQNLIVPKILKNKTYVICPIIDMANHASNTTKITANVAYEYLRNSYSLSTTTILNKNSNDETQQHQTEQQVYISYGPRTNDQLLQYFGFVEVDNPNDIYVMPSLRQWDISALEKACGRSFGNDRLVKLERAGLLGQREKVATSSAEEDYSSRASTASGGVVLSRTQGVDPAILQALRALVSTEEEWEVFAGKAIGNFATQVSEENERLARLAAKTAIQLELDSKPTTLEQDMELWRKTTLFNANESAEERLALLFRIEKKKLLIETISNLE